MNGLMVRRKKYRFEVNVRVEELEKVPFVNQVLYAKVRLLDGGFTDHSARFDYQITVKMSVTCEQSSPASSPCAFCQVLVQPSRHALQCTMCGQWQHRVCHRGNKSGVTHEDYLDLVEGRVVFKWQCVKCPQPGREIGDVITREIETIDRTIILEKYVESDNSHENTHNATIESQNVTQIEITSIQLESTDNETKELPRDETIELEQSKYVTIQLADPQNRTIKLEQSCNGIRTCDLEQSENGAIELEMSENGSVVVEQSGNATILLKQLEAVGDTFILEPKDFVTSELRSLRIVLDQSEDGDNTLFFEPPLHPLIEYSLNGSNIYEGENTINQDEMSTVLFPSNPTTPSVDTESVIDIVTPSQHNPKNSASSPAPIHLESTSVLNNHSVNNASFNSISFNQSTPIASNRPSRRRAASFLRRVSAITVNVPSPDRDVTFSFTGLNSNNTTRSNASQCCKASPIDYSFLYKQVARNKRRISTEEESPASKKRIIENI